MSVERCTTIISRVEMIEQEDKVGQQCLQAKRDIQRHYLELKKRIEVRAIIFERRLNVKR